MSRQILFDYFRSFQNAESASPKSASANSPNFTKSSVELDPCLFHETEPWTPSAEKRSALAYIDMSHAFAADDGDLDAAPYTETQYQASYSYSSANSSTMPIMMGFVFLGYFALLTVYLSFCCVGRQVYSFQALTNVEQQTIAGGKPQLPGPVAHLDEIWRKQFIVKVYGILCIQLAVTVAICFGMMQ
jgi:hypothetical protein